jgi:hypothetical protein
LFIFDRSDDPVTPFLHELTYQAMVYDYVEVGDDDMVDLRLIPGNSGEWRLMDGRMEDGWMD